MSGVVELIKLDPSDLIYYEESDGILGKTIRSKRGNGIITVGEHVCVVPGPVLDAISPHKGERVGVIRCQSRRTFTVTAELR